MLFTRLAEKLFIKLFRHGRFNVRVYIAKLRSKTHVNTVELAGVMFLCVGQDSISGFFLNEIGDFTSPGMR
jgi:hypothetical protein